MGNTRHIDSLLDVIITCLACIDLLHLVFVTLNVMIIIIHFTDYEYNTHTTTHVLIPAFTATSGHGVHHKSTMDPSPLHPAGTAEGQYEVLRHGVAPASDSRTDATVNTLQHHLTSTQEGQYEVLRREFQTASESGENNGYVEISQNRMIKPTLSHEVDVNTKLDNPLYAEARCH